jgi:hypothetical protein
MVVGPLMTIFDKIDANSCADDIADLEAIRDYLTPSDVRIYQMHINVVHGIQSNIDDGLIDWDDLYAEIQESFWTYCADIDMMNTHKKSIEWDIVCRNVNAVPLLFDNPGRINWDELSYNSSAEELLRANPNQINLTNSASNPALADLNIEEFNRTMINGLNQNTSPLAIKFLREHPIFICSTLSLNPAGLNLLEQHKDKVFKRYLKLNPAIVEYDYEAIRTTNQPRHEELIAYLHHPTRIAKWLEAGNDLEEYLIV